MPFDADSFLNTPFTGVTDSRRAVCPIGFYPALITKADPVAPKEEGQRAKLEVFCAPQGYSGPPVRYTCWLDLLQDGTLDPGEFKNGQLQIIRASAYTPRFSFGLCWHHSAAAVSLGCSPLVAGFPFTERFSSQSTLHLKWQ